MNGGGEHPKSMKTSAKKRCSTRPTTVTDKSRAIEIIRNPAETEEQAVARMIVQGTVSNASTTIEYSRAQYSGLSLTDIAHSLTVHGEAANRGDLGSLERMLTGQAVALNAMFAELARRGALNMGINMDVAERYVRLAFKAQGQARATVETLAAIKNPPVVFARQANINNGGQQQVNNRSDGPLPVSRSHAAESGIEPNKLLETSNGERLDIGTQGAASRADSLMAPLGRIDGTKKRSR